MKDPYRSKPSTVYRIARFLRAIYPHLIFILSFMFLVFYVLEKFNPVMGFLTGRISMVLLLLFFLLSFIGSVCTIVYRAWHCAKQKSGKED